MKEGCSHDNGLSDSEPWKGRSWSCLGTHCFGLSRVRLFWSVFGVGIEIGWRKLEKVGVDESST